MIAYPRLSPGRYDDKLGRPYDVLEVVGDFVSRRRPAAGAPVVFEHHDLFAKRLRTWVALGAF